MRAVPGAFSHCGSLYGWHMPSASNAGSQTGCVVSSPSHNLCVASSVPHCGNGICPRAVADHSARRNLRRVCSRSLWPKVCHLLPHLVWQCHGCSQSAPNPEWNVSAYAIIARPWSMAWNATFCLVVPGPVHYPQGGFPPATRWSRWRGNMVFCWYNDEADLRAIHALSLLPQKLLDVQEQLTVQLRRKLQLQQTLHQYFIQVGQTAVRFSDQHDTHADHDPRRDAIHADMVIPLRHLSSKLDAAAPRARIAQFYKVQSWLRHLQASEDVPPTWVTWPELMWSFQAGIQGIMTAPNNSGWVEASLCHEYDANRECHTFAYYLTHLIRYWNPEFKSTFTKPSNFRWQCWAKCVPIRWNRADASAVHGWLESHLGARVIRAVRKDLCDVPPATSICVVDAPHAIGLHRYFERCGG